METDSREKDSADFGGHAQAATDTPEVLADDLIEDVSIDGMCGVY